MPERTWIPKLICRDWRDPWRIKCPWLDYDEAHHKYLCCHGRVRELATNHAGSPLRRPDCPIGLMSVEDRSYKPRRQG